MVNVIIFNVTTLSLGWRATQFSCLFFPSFQNVLCMFSMPDTRAWWAHIAEIMEVRSHFSADCSDLWCAWQYLTKFSNAVVPAGQAQKLQCRKTETSQINRLCYKKQAISEVLENPILARKHSSFVLWCYDVMESPQQCYKFVLHECLSPDLCACSV